MRTTMLRKQVLLASIAAAALALGVSTRASADVYADGAVRPYAYPAPYPAPAPAYYGTQPAAMSPSAEYLESAPAPYYVPPPAAYYPAPAYAYAPAPYYYAPAPYYYGPRFGGPSIVIGASFGGGRHWRR